PPGARIADTAAVSVHVVGRGGVFRMILRIPLVGTPFRLPLTERIVDVAALVVSVDLIGECGGDKYQRRRHDTGRWQNIERHDVLLDAAAQPHAIDARCHTFGGGHLEIGIPAAIVEVVLVEMDRGVMPWPMPPGCLFAGPARAAYRPRRQVAEGAVQRVRPAVEDAVACYFLAEIPIGGTGVRVGLQRCACVMYARQDLRSGRSE